MYYSHNTEVAWRNARQRSNLLHSLQIRKSGDYHYLTYVHLFFDTDAFQNLAHLGRQFKMTVQNIRKVYVLYDRIVFVSETAKLDGCKACNPE